MAVKRDNLFEFKYSFLLPTKDFKGTEYKDLKVKIDFIDTRTNKYMRGQSVGSFHFQKCYFNINIPKYITDYIKGKFRIYTKDGINQQGTYAEGTPIWQYKYDFKNSIKSQQFNDLIIRIEQITVDALYIKKLEDLEKHNKIIFVRSNYFVKEQVDNYNFGLKGNKLDLNFQYFVAYKIIKKNNFMKQYWQSKCKDSNDVIEYYAISQKQFHAEHNPNRNHKKLPLLTGYEIDNFTEIPWTQEREDFFRDIEMKITKVSMLITDFVKDVDATNIDLKITENKKILLLDTDSNEKK